jgi:hypothetical protein
MRPRGARGIHWSTGLRVGLSVIGLVMIWVTIGGALASPENPGYDARAYWGYPRDAVYAGPGEAAGYGIYRYSPVFVPLMALLTAIPWSYFLALWITTNVLIYRWLAGPWWLAFLAFPPFVMELRMGNIHLLLALAIVLGFRWPAAWAFVLLTKVTPGVGLLWFAVRREWRSLTVALGATAGLAAVSAAVSPGLWLDWIRSLDQTAEPDVILAIPVPLWLRLVAAAMLVVWGARTDRRWTVVVAATLSLPVLWVHGLAMLAGVAAVQRGLPEASAGGMRSPLPALRRAAPEQPAA